MEMRPKANCPLDGFKPCRQLECGWFTQLRGVNPNTNKEVDEWGCAMAWVPMLLVENSSQSRQVGAAVESFRNEMVRSNEASLAALLSASKNTTKRIDQ